VRLATTEQDEGTTDTVCIVRSVAHGLELGYGRLGA